MTVDQIVEQAFSLPEQEHALEVLHQDYARQLEQLEQNAYEIYKVKDERR